MFQLVRGGRPRLAMLPLRWGSWRCYLPAAGVVTGVALLLCLLPLIVETPNFRPWWGLFPYEGPNGHVIKRDDEVFPHTTSLRFLPHSTLHGCLENVVTLQPGGPLGIAVMQYASALAVAREFNLTLVLPKIVARFMRGAFEDVEAPTIEEFLKGKNTTDGKPCSQDLSEQNVLDTLLLGKVEESRAKPDGNAAVAHEKWIANDQAMLPLIRKFRPELRFRRELRDRAQDFLRKTGKEAAKAAGARLEEVAFIGIDVQLTETFEYETDAWLKFAPRVDLRHYEEALSSMSAALRAERATAPPQEAPGGAQAPSLPVAAVVAGYARSWVNSPFVAYLQRHARAENTTIRVFGADSERNILKHAALLSSCNHSIFSFSPLRVATALLAGGRAIVISHVRQAERAKRIASLFPNWTVKRNVHITIR